MALNSGGTWAEAVSGLVECATASPDRNNDAPRAVNTDYALADHARAQQLAVASFAHVLGVRILPNRAIKLEVSKRLPPWDWMSA